MTEDRDVYLVFDKGDFYVREGVGNGVVFHELEGAHTEPKAREILARKGFDRKMKLVRIEQ